MQLNKKQKKDNGCSGKKKTTVKTRTLVASRGKIKAVSKTVKGNIYDKKPYDNTTTITLT